MKPTLRKFSPAPSQSFYLQQVKGVEMVNPWHFHPEIEIVYIKKSAGSIAAGDFLGNFQTGTVLLFGAYLPHTTVHLPMYLQDNEDQGEAITVHFLADAVVNPLSNSPEMADIQKFLQNKTHRGILLFGNSRQKVAQLLEDMVEATPARKMIALWSILDEMAHTAESQVLASKGYTHVSSVHDDKRLQAVYDFTFANYQRPVYLEELAALTHLTRQSFCRFFKERNRKTYYQFLMEVRIGHACRFLMEDKLSVADASWRSGYRNMANFIRQFKKITGQNPLQYSKQMRSTLESV